MDNVDGSTAYAVIQSNGCYDYGQQLLWQLWMHVLKPAL